MKKFIEISFGFLSDSLQKQLSEQDVKFDPFEMTIFEEERRAINSLSTGNEIISDDMAKELFSKLIKKISQHLADYNGLQSTNPQKEID